MIEQKFRLASNDDGWKYIDSLLKLGERFRCSITFQQENKILNAKGFMWIGSLQLEKSFSVIYDGIDEVKASKEYEETLDLLTAS